VQSSILLASEPLTVGMFVIGLIIFILYMVGYLYMVTTAHKQQRRELEGDPEYRKYQASLRESSDNIDYDGHGNWGRFPNNPYDKKKKKK
tara:strand:+ start:412 stop:681 length:270 start_codon:yes stop_codon:yes gene_type:complete